MVERYCKIVKVIIGEENIMISQELIDRINVLARKSKESGLTAEETKEQIELRQEYLTAFRGGMMSQLASIKVVDPNGNDVTPKKLKQYKKDLKNNK